MSNKRLTIVCPSILPVPATKGGAVENLLENFIRYNSRIGKIDLDLISIFEQESNEILSRYQNVKGNLIKNSTFQIRVNTILKNCLLKKIPVTYYKKIINQIIKLGNQSVLVEGGLACAIEIKRRLPDYKIYYHSHGLEFDHLSSSDLKIVNNFDGIFFVSNFCLNRAVNKQVNKTICHFLMNRIDLEQFDRIITEEEKREFLKAYNIDENRKNIVYKGRLVREKGIIELIEAFNKLTNKDCSLLICGGRNFDKKYFFASKLEKEMKREINKNSQIKHLGYIPYKDIPILNSLTSLSVLPSRWDDPAPLVLIESIVSKIPTLASNRGGMTEYAKDAGVELIDENCFIDSMREKIDYILSNDEQMEKMKIQSSEQINKYNFEDYYNELCNYFI